MPIDPTKPFVRPGLTPNVNANAPAPNSPIVNPPITHPVNPSFTPGPSSVNPPVNPTPPVPVKPAIKSDPKIEIMKKMGKIEAEFGGFGQIPLTHAYWGLRKELDALNQVK